MEPRARKRASMGGRGEGRVILVAKTVTAMAAPVCPASLEPSGVPSCLI